ncbi:hypothetical protein SAMN05880556_11172 [Azospirillum sp. RU38E]|nr:hypothetical protein SAMN05880556_11172 [Azospirillum sp. RU38E]SNS94178.1 hypothetical protein SAMN05880591_11172 [Azospirillum sp. RU37A]
MVAAVMRLKGEKNVLRSLKSQKGEPAPAATNKMAGRLVPHNFRTNPKNRLRAQTGDFLIKPLKNNIYFLYSRKGGAKE